MEPPNKIRRHGLASQTNIHSYPSGSNGGVVAEQQTSSLAVGEDKANNSNKVDKMSIVNNSPTHILHFPMQMLKNENKGKLIEANLAIYPDDSNNNSLFGSPYKASTQSKDDNQGKKAVQGMSGLTGQDMAVVLNDDDDDDDGSLFGDPSPADLESGNALLVQQEEALAGANTPDAMSCVLLPHQRIGLEWLLKHEHGKGKGGILADDMGLGKTIQALALIFANPPKDPNCRTTLIVAPLALLQQWPREIDDKTKPGYKLKVHIFHGNGRKISVRQMLSYDVVLTNYESLTAEVKMEEDQVKEGRVLLNPNARFHRIILDEAHTIKNRKALCAQGAFRLEAEYRLAMTGTPLMNKAEELYSVMNFLRVPRYSDWDYFHRHIGLPLEGKKGGHSTPEGAMRKITKLKKRTMLVRKKTDMLDGKPIISLPSRTDVVDHCIFDEDEQAFYLALQGKVQVVLKKFMNAGKGDRGFHIMLVQLLRLRQACCHPDLLTSNNKQKDELQPENLADLDGETLAAIENAGDLAASPAAPNGSSGMAGTAKKQAKMASTEPQKPKNKPRTKAESLEYYRQLERDYQPSSKINKTLEILTLIKETSPQDKVVVFSFFTSYLDMLQIAFRRAGFVFKRYDGTLSPAEKDVVIRDFTSAHSSTKILLTSLKSGNAGLNLSITNHVILSEPFWNPFVEQQAIDRAHRIGQMKHVYVHRLLVRGTVEESIMELQNRKRAMVELAIGNGSSAEKQQQFKNMGGVTKTDLLKLLRPGLTQAKEPTEDGAMDNTKMVSSTTSAPWKAPTEAPTEASTKAPAKALTKVPTKASSKVPSKAPLRAPTKALASVPPRVPQGGKARTSVPAPAPPLAGPPVSMFRASSRAGNKHQDRSSVGGLARLAASFPPRVPAAPAGPRRSLLGGPTSGPSRVGSMNQGRPQAGGLASLETRAPPRAPAAQAGVQPGLQAGAEARDPGDMPVVVPPSFGEKPRFGEESVAESSAASRKFGPTDLNELLAKHGGQGRRGF